MSSRDTGGRLQKATNPRRVTGDGLPTSCLHTKMRRSSTLKQGMRNVVTDREMDALEQNGTAEILFRPAAEEEFGKVFRRTRGNQLVARVIKYYRHTQFGYEEIKAEEMEENTK